MQIFWKNCAIGFVAAWSAVGLAPAADEMPPAAADGAPVMQSESRNNADNESSGSSSRRNRRSRRGGFGGGPGGGGMPPMMSNLAEKYPTEMAEIEKLRESDPEAARTKMRELFEKAGMGRGDRRMGPPGMGPGGELSEDLIAKLKEKCPEEYAEYEKLKESDPEAAREKLRELMQKAGLFPPHGEQQQQQEQMLIRDRHRTMLARVREELKKRYPERYAAIEKKWKTDPDGARRDFRALFAEADIDITAGQTSLEYDYAEETNKKNNTSQSNRGGFGGPGGMGGPGFGPPPGGFGPPPGMGGGR